MITTSQGTIAYTLNDKGKEKIVLLIHGYSSHRNRPSTKGLGEALEKRGMSTLRIDLPGHGESDGVFAEQTISTFKEAASAAITFAKAQGFQSILLYGSSAGGITALATALDHPEIAKMALKAPVSNYAKQREETMGEEAIKEWKEKGYAHYHSGSGKELRVNYSFYEDAKHYNMWDLAKNISFPVLILHGTKDEAVNIEDSKNLVQVLPKGELIIVEGDDHGLSNNFEWSIETFAEWLMG